MRCILAGTFAALALSAAGSTSAHSQAREFRLDAGHCDVEFAIALLEIPAGIVRRFRPVKFDGRLVEEILPGSKRDGGRSRPDRRPVAWNAEKRHRQTSEDSRR